MVATHPLRRAPARADTLVIVGGEGVTTAAAPDGPIVEFLRRSAPRVRRVVSICTGAFVLASAGVLDGKRATTHWAYADTLAAFAPRATIDADAIFVRDGRVHTSAGITAGMDLALALVEADLGRDTALAIARHLVMYVHRAGGQSQFSAPMQSQIAARDSLRAVQAYVMDHPSADLSVAALAKRAGTSTRHFARVFTREVGSTPADFVERARVNEARRLLEQTAKGLGEIADACGFRAGDTLTRAFARHLKTTPGAYRKRFRAF